MYSIKQGETLDISAILKDDNDIIIKDYTNRKLSVILMGAKQNIITKWSTETEGAEPLDISPDGVVSFAVTGTEALRGVYYLEFKVTEENVLIGKQLVQFEVLNSAIGREVTL